MKKLRYFLDNKIIEADLQWTKNQNIYLKVTKHNTILVTAPLGTQIKIIDEFVKQHILKFYNYANKSSEKILFSFENKFVYLFGKKIKLEFMKNVENQNYKESGGKLWLLTLNSTYEENLNLINDFLKKKALYYLKQQQSKWEKIMGIPKHSCSVSFKTTTWGTNSVLRKSIRYAVTIIHFSKEAIDYLVVHELAHHIEPNHSDRFWWVVEKYIPNYKTIRKQLKKDSRMEE